jgi:hypothetical protein
LHPQVHTPMALAGCLIQGILEQVYPLTSLAAQPIISSPRIFFWFSLTVP